jgi:hypothetical protein
MSIFREHRKSKVPRPGPVARRPNPNAIEGLVSHDIAGAFANSNISNNTDWCKLLARFFRAPSLAGKSSEEETKLDPPRLNA